MRSLPELARHISNQLERGRGVRLEAADLDLLASVGVVEAISEAAARQQREEAAARVAARGAPRREPAAKGVSADRATAAEAAERLQRILQPQRR